MSNGKYISVIAQKLDDHLRSRPQTEQQYLLGVETNVRMGRPQNSFGAHARGGHPMDNPSLLISVERQIERLIDDVRGTFLSRC